MRFAKESGCILSYDPNLRLALWPSAEAARDGIMSIWDQADVIKVYYTWLGDFYMIYFINSNSHLIVFFPSCFMLKISILLVNLMWYFFFMFVQISEDEITFLTGGDDPYDDNVVLKKLFHPNLKLLIVTEGSEGCRYYTKVLK